MQLIMQPNININTREIALFDSRDGFTLDKVTSTKSSLRTLLNTVRSFAGSDGYANPVSGKVGQKYVLPMLRCAGGVPTSASGTAPTYFEDYINVDISARSLNGYTSKIPAGSNALATLYASTQNQVLGLPKTNLGKVFSGTGISIKFPSEEIRSGTNTPFTGSAVPQYYDPYYYQMNSDNAAPANSQLNFTGLNSLADTGECTGNVNLSLVQYIAYRNTYQGTGISYGGSYSGYMSATGTPKTDGIIYLSDSSLTDVADESVTIDRALAYFGTYAYLMYPKVENVVPGSRPKIDLGTAPYINRDI